MDAIATTILIAVALYVAAGLVTGHRLCHVRGHGRAKRAGDGRRTHPPAAGRDRAVAAGAVPLAQGTSSAMRRPHRTAHRVLWPALAVLVGIALGDVARDAGAAAGAAAGRDRGAAMSVGFKAVQWNREKLIYDAILLAGGRALS